MSHKTKKPAAAKSTYGILVGTIQDGQEDPASDKSPHYEIWVKGNGDYRVAVNVKSTDGSEVLAYFDANYQQATKLDLPTRAAAKPGFTELKTGPSGKGLDYVRDNLFPLDQMASIPPEGAGVTLASLLDAQIERAKADSEAVILVCGDSYYDKGKDTTFGFSPEQGSHNIHMMQGNSGSFADENRVNGDGALFIRYTGGETVALFIRFATESTSTDGQTGDPISSNPAQTSPHSLPCNN
jgi:uncharacterized protein YukJ